MKLLEKLLAPNISKLESQGNVTALAKLLESNGRLDLRIAALDALARIGGDRAIQPLVAMLSEGDGAIAVAAEKAIRGLVPIPSNELVAILGGKGGDAAMKILLSLGEPAFEILACASRDHDEKVRLRALEGLVELHDRGDLDAGREIFFRAVLASLGDRSPQIRTFAAQQLGILGDAKAGRGLAAQLKDGEDGVRAACRKALLAIGEPVVPHLLEALADRNVNSRRISAELLGEICSSEVSDHSRRIALMALVDRADDSTAEIASASQHAIAAIPSETVINAQLERLADPEQSDHEEIVEFLRQMIAYGKLQPEAKHRLSEKIDRFENFSEQSF